VSAWVAGGGGLLGIAEGSYAQAGPRDFAGLHGPLVRGWDEMLEDPDAPRHVRPVNGGREGITLPEDRPLPAGPDSPELPDALFRVPVALLDAILTRLAPVDLPIRHFWGDGFLVREMTIPAGTLIVARRYKVPHVCTCSGGEITVWGDGVEPVIVEAPWTDRAEPGVQRVGYAHRDTVWSTVLPNPQGLADPEAVLDACAEVTPLDPRFQGVLLRELLGLLETPVRLMLSEEVAE